jgi:hypothetical protein
MKMPSLTSPYRGREPAIKAKEPEVPSAGGTDGLVGGGNRFCRGKPHLWRPPPQHRRQRPPAHQHHTSEWRPPQCAPTGPHSRPRHRSEDETVPEHGHRPRCVRRVVRPLGAAGAREGPWTWPTYARRDRHPCGGRTATPRPGSRWQFASSVRLVDALLLRMLKEEAGRQPMREAEHRLGSPSSPARMMNILEAEGKGEATARLALPHHNAGGHHPG